jgi:hypothetical protein
MNESLEVTLQGISGNELMNLFLIESDHLKQEVLHRSIQLYQHMIIISASKLITMQLRPYADFQQLLIIKNPSFFHWFRSTKFTGLGVSNTKFNGGLPVGSDFQI